jgi:DNA polymerase-1
VNIYEEIESILNKDKEKKKRKLKVREKWYLDEVYPLFKDKFSSLNTEQEVERFLAWAKKKNFKKRELQIIKMSQETVLPRHYNTVWTEQDLEELVTWLSGLDMVAIDTETTGTDKYRDEIVGISFYAPHQGYYIPLKHIDDIRYNADAYEEFKEGGGEEKLTLGVDYIKCLPLELVKEKLKPWLGREGLKQIYHNYGFDYHIIRRYFDVKTVCYFDTMIAQAILDETQSKALKHMATHYLKIPSDTFSQLFGNVTFDRVPCLINPKTRTGNMATFYATKDTELTYKMYEFQIKHLKSPNLKKLHDLYFNIEIPFINIVVEAEERGIRVDEDYLVNTVAPQLHRELEELRENIYKYTGEINLNSPQQLSKVLYEDLGLPRVNQKKPDSTDRKTLNKIKNEHEVIPMILEYRQVVKLVDAFADKLPNQIINGRIHTSFSTIKDTGRMSSSNPKEIGA